MTTHLKFYRFAQSALLLALLFSPAAFSEPLPPLNPSERAIYEVLRGFPRYKYGSVLLDLVSKGEAEFEIGREITFESLDKLNRYLPGLLEVVQKGRAFRVAYLNQAAVEAEIMAFSSNKIDPNPASRLITTYYELLRAHRKKKPFEPSEKQLRPLAYETIRVRYGYPLTVPLSSWKDEHQREFETEIEILKRFYTQPKAINELPEKVLEEWILGERKRHARLKERFPQLLLDIPIRDRAEITASAQKLLKSAQESSEEVRQLLLTTSPKELPSFLLQLESAAIVEAERLRKDKAELFGDPVNRRGGKFSPLREPEHDWIQDIYWWGLSDGGTRNPQVGLSEKWAKKAASSKRLLGIFPFLKNPSIEKVAQPEAYDERIRKLWEQRYERTKKYVRWGVKWGLISAAVVASAERLFHYGPTLLQSASHYVNGTSPPSTGEPPEPWELFPSALKGLSKQATAPGAKNQAGSATSGGVMEGTAKAHKKSNSQPRTGGSETPLFQLKALSLAANQLPTEFEFANHDEWDNQPENVLRGPRAAFSIETKVPLAVGDNGRVSLLGVPGYVPVVTEAYYEGKKLTDFETGNKTSEFYFQTAHAPRSGASWLWVTVPSRYNKGKSIAWKALYYPVGDQSAQRSLLPPSSLPPIPLHQAAWLQALLRDAGHTAQANALEKLVGARIATESPLRPEALDAIVKLKSKYSTEAAQEIDSPSLFNPLLGFSPYLREPGIDCFDCDGARNMLAAELRLAWDNDSKIKIENRTLFIREPGSLSIFPSGAHARLAVYQDGFAPNETVIFDPTPITKAKGSVDPPPRFATELEAKNRAKEESLLELSLRKFATESEPTEKGLVTKTSDSHQSEGESAPPYELPTNPPLPRGPWFIERRRETPSETSRGTLRFRNYHQLPPGPFVSEMEVLARPMPEQPDQSIEDKPSPPEPEAAPVSAAEPPPTLDEAAILREAKEELARRKRQNELLLSAVAKQRVLAANLALTAETAGLSAQEPTEPHNAATRIASRISSYITGEIPSLIKLQNELRAVEIPVPESLESEADLRKLIELAKQRADKGNENLAKLEAAARRRKSENKRGHAFGEFFVEPAKKLLNTFNSVFIQPVQSEDFREIYRETRETHIRRFREKYPGVECAEALDRLY